MYLVKTKNENKICETVAEIKTIPEDEVIELYTLTTADYADVISNASIRDCIYQYLKGKHYPKEDVIEFVADSLGVKRGVVSKVVTTMKKEKIIHLVKKAGTFYGCIGID